MSLSDIGYSVLVSKIDDHLQACEHDGSPTMKIKIAKLNRCIITGPPYSKNRISQNTRETLDNVWLECFSQVTTCAWFPPCDNSLSTSPDILWLSTKRYVYPRRGYCDHSVGMAICVPTRTNQFEAYTSRPQMLRRVIGGIPRCVEEPTMHMQNFCR